ncbi:LicD family-domain-containing protein [Scheffersomyces coipomensis]|uniref:LicD family-domain-containing protein n=1 Tax=Scheffersomyces coipomensis TaxID=1788519 RepID=UPI00315C8D08
MVLPKFYNKRLKNLFIGLILLTTLFISFNFQIFDFSLSFPVNTKAIQTLLETQALKQQRDSDFNPRSPLFALYSYLNNQPNPKNIGNSDGIFFHWDDWTDLSPGNKILNPYRHQEPSGKCDSIIEQFASVDGYWIESYDKKVLRSTTNLYCLKEIPQNIYLMNDDSMTTIPVIGKKRLDYTIIGGDHVNNIDLSKQKLISEMIKYEKLPEKKFEITPYKKSFADEIDIDVEDFIFNPDLEIFKLQNKLNDKSISEKELNYLQFLKYSNNYAADNSGRYFKYPWIITDIVTGRSHHLAYPFFKRFIGDRERQSIVHHIIRVWFEFAKTNDFVSWINYGNLLGWEYNGVNMPWDTDVDIQMPIVQLDRLAREFNQSLIIENPRYGNGKYLLEVSPTYIKQGNGKNFIDARFIDINSGIYIDLTALSHSNFKPPSDIYDKIEGSSDLTTMFVHCKNWNWHTIDELLPLQQSYFEGSPVLIPHNVTQILSRKYGKESISSKLHFQNHNYQTDIQMWVPDSICKNAPSLDHSRFDKFNNSLTFEGACKSDILQDEYNILSECIHRDQLLKSKEVEFDELKELPLFRKDPWDYFNDINNRLVDNERWYVNQEIV